jgi:hypothetical protein
MNFFISSYLSIGSNGGVERVMETTNIKEKIMYYLLEDCLWNQIYGKVENI